jgi:plastocyanin
MKHLFTLLFVVVVCSAANATVHIVTCQNSPAHFLPESLNATVGDTIHWTWIEGNHIVGPVNISDIPAGAAIWNGYIDASHHDFEYVVTHVGVYYYDCHPGTPHGENASITVTGTTGVQHNLQNAFSSAYPNPFTETITIETSNAEQILLYNTLGKKVNSFTLKSGQTKLQADLGTLPEGIYFYSIIRNGAVIETRKIMKAK